MFEEIIEQHAAKSLLQSAVEDGPVHAYLFHGPPGVGKQKTALAFAAHLLGDRGRVERRAHPDLYLLEPLGDQIRIDEVRRLRRDLHMRPFEAEWRVYLLVSAHSLNEEAADALLKDLEEPPPYAVLILLADELGPLPETIRSRCQLVPFSRLSEKAVHTVLAAQAPGLAADRITALARVAGGRLDRAERLLDEDAATRREELLALARGVYADPSFEPSSAAASVVRMAETVAREARAEAEAEVEWLDLPDRERDQWLRRAEFGANRESVLEALEELTAWYRDSSWWPSAPRRSSRISTTWTSCEGTARPSGSRAPRARRRSCASRGAGSRSSTSSPGWRSKRSSCDCAASWLLPD